MEKNFVDSSGWKCLKSDTTRSKFTGVPWLIHQLRKENVKVKSNFKFSHLIQDLTWIGQMEENRSRIAQVANV